MKGQESRPARSANHPASGVFDLTGIRLRLTVVLTVIGATLVYSSAVFVQSSIWLFRQPLVPTSGAYVYTYWGAAALGCAGLSHINRTTTTQRQLPTASTWILGVFAFWMLLTAFWSVAPAVTPSSALLMVLTLSVGVWLGRRPTCVEVIAGLSIGCQLLVVWSAAYVAFTNRGTDLGRWVGVFASRNSLGPIATFSILMMLIAGPAVLRRGTRLGKALFVGLIVLDTAVAVEALSVTSFVALAAGVAVLAATWLARRMGATAARAAVPGALMLGVSGVGVALAWPAVAASLLGKESTFSDRRVIWNYLIETTRQRMNRGFGYGAFWTDANLVYPLYELTGSVYDSAHSTFVEVYIAGGVVTVTSLVALVTVAAVRLCQWWMQSRDQRAGIYLSILAFCIVENASESMINYHSIFWLIVVALAFVPTGLGQGRDFVADGVSDPHN